MDKVKIFKEHLARVTESANKPNDLHKQQLIKSSNKLIQMFEEQQKEIEELFEGLHIARVGRRDLTNYVKELKEEIERLETELMMIRQ